jgi:hypothetical protein
LGLSALTHGVVPPFSTAAASASILARTTEFWKSHIFFGAKDIV